MSQQLERVWITIMDKPSTRDVLDFFAHDANRTEWYSRHEISDETGIDHRSVTKAADLLIDAGLLERSDDDQYVYRRPDKKDVNATYYHLNLMDQYMTNVVV